MGWYRSYRGFAPYVSVAKRKEAAKRKIATLKKKGNTVDPVVVDGRMIAKTFWGKAWCNHLESYSDYDNRLPRGRTYVRNGSVIDLKILAGEIQALVSGSSIYKVKMTIAPIVEKKWKAMVAQCVGKIDSLIELLQGKFSKSVMEIMTGSETGLFPSLKEIKLQCSCPDYATMCKHIAAVLYGVGTRLDTEPQALFLLRNADHTELLTHVEDQLLATSTTTQDTDVLTDDDLSRLFDIAIEEKTPTSTPKLTVAKTKKPLLKKTIQKKSLINKITTSSKPAKTTLPIKSVVKSTPLTKKSRQKKVSHRIKSNHSKTTAVKPKKIVSNNRRTTAKISPKKTLLI